MRGEVGDTALAGGRVREKPTVNNRVTIDPHLSLLTLHSTYPHRLVHVIPPDPNKTMDRVRPVYPVGIPAHGPKMHITRDPSIRIRQAVRGRFGLAARAESSTSLWPMAYGPWALILRISANGR